MLKNTYFNELPLFFIGYLCFNLNFLFNFGPRNN